MANYKVVDADKLDSDLALVADAIRAKAGTEDSLAFPDGMENALQDMQTYDDGFSDGYDEGYDLGYSDGESYGYEMGYEDGIAEGGGGGAVTTFYIDYYDNMNGPEGSPTRSTTLQFEEGMTWEDWVGSSYNTIGAYFDEMDYENHLWVDGSYMYFNVKKTSIIGEWATYKALMY